MSSGLATMPKRGAVSKRMRRSWSWSLPVFKACSGAVWQAQVFRDKASGEEQLALVHGTLDTDRPVLVRMHSLDLFADVLGESCARSGVLQGAMRMIEAEGSGVVVTLHAAAPGSLSRSIDLRSGKPVEAGDAVRGYGTGAQILAALGIHDMILLSNTRHAPVGLSAYGLAIIEERCIASKACPTGADSAMVGS